MKWRFDFFKLVIPIPFWTRYNLPSLLLMLISNDIALKVFFEQVFGRTSIHFKAHDLYCMSEFSLALMNSYHPSPKTVILDKICNYKDFIEPHVVKGGYPRMNDFRCFRIQRPSAESLEAHIYTRRTVAEHDEISDPWSTITSMTPLPPFLILDRAFL